MSAPPSPVTPASARPPKLPARLLPSSKYFRRRSSVQQLQYVASSSVAGTYYRTFSVVVFTAIVLCLMLYSSLRRQVDSKGCNPAFYSPSYAKIKSFDTDHTRFASKYSLFLYREQTLDNTREPRGVPVLFIPGNAGSYKQVREIAAEAAHQYYDALFAKGTFRDDPGSSSLDFFTADFNEDFTAFHGHTLLDQAEYLNDAIAFILSLYSPSRNENGDDTPLPRSVILIGHSMGGIVARTMLTLPNYRPDSVNTIITLSTPHVVPPATFDWDIVNIFEKINQYWRKSYSDDLVGKNPLASVSLISITGGKLDAIVPSDFTSVSSLLPSTNGFTVFTSSIPNVWTGVDHLAVVWCNQLRRAIAQALLHVVDTREPTQTKSLEARMEVFRSQFLTGLEPEVAKKAPLALGHDTLLRVQDTPSIISKQRQKRLTLRGLGSYRRPQVHLLPIPADLSESKDDILSILTDQTLELDGKDQRVDIFLCQSSHRNTFDSDYLHTFNNVLDFSKPDSKTLTFVCSNMAQDKVVLPASTRDSKFAHDGSVFSYVQYRMGDLFKYQYVAVVDSYADETSGFVTMEMIDSTAYKYDMHLDLKSSLSGDLTISLPSGRAGFSEVTLSGLSNSLISYKLDLAPSKCADSEMFAPLIRQFLSDPHESKYFPNARKIQIGFHGAAPFVPLTSLPGGSFSEQQQTLKLQIWRDPTTACGERDEQVTLRVSVDMLGSLGNLVIRYRTATAALPLAIVGMVMLMQFNIYDASGTFITFGAALEAFIGKALPILCLVSASFIALSPHLFPTSTLPFMDPADQPAGSSDADASINDRPVYRIIRDNDLFLGISDPRLCLLGPLLFTLATGLCIVVYYVVAIVLLFIATTLDCLDAMKLQASPPAGTDSPPTAPSQTIPRVLTSRERVGKFFSSTLLLRFFAFLLTQLFVGLYNFVSMLAVFSGGKRLITIFTLLLIVSAYVPFQFAFIVVFIVHINTCIKSLRTQSYQYGLSERFSPMFSNFAVSILMLMIWILPINIPLLVVWIHNLSVKWTTPFSSHHNLLSIMPIILLVENMISGKMLPRNTQVKQQIVTKILLVYLIVYSCLHGILNAYWLHHIVNIFALWLFIVYLELLSGGNYSYNSERSGNGSGEVDSELAMKLPQTSFGSSSVIATVPTSASSTATTLQASCGSSTTVTSYFDRKLERVPSMNGKQ
ncbi:GPI inositol-deacylase [Myxozyma melibiosi]|uniref:GPI inositol-deacylase n=1 Tax=Myxozyma melibiosi TaxID=54550 RepID=A0ABR1FBJ8_9ASCO